MRNLWWLVGFSDPGRPISDSQTSWLRTYSSAQSSVYHRCSNTDQTVIEACANPYFSSIDRHPFGASLRHLRVTRDPH